MRLVRHRWVKLVALVGVMFNAYAFVGHRAHALSMAFAQASATAGSIVICRADGGVEVVSFAKLVDGKPRSPAKSAAACPHCCAATPAFAIAEPDAIAFATLGGDQASPVPQPAALPVARASKPPATGPPALV